MAECKLVIGDTKTGKCIQKVSEIKELIGKKIGETIKGEIIELQGYELIITGGSDSCGFPMRKGINSARKRVLITKGVGFKGGRKGLRKRKTVCGETITENINQINMKVTKYGEKPLIEEKAEEGKKTDE